MLNTSEKLDYYFFNQQADMQRWDVMSSYLVVMFSVIIMPSSRVGIILSTCSCPDNSCPVRPCPWAALTAIAEKRSSARG